jgi:hypothetical protein
MNIIFSNGKSSPAVRKTLSSRKIPKIDHTLFDWQPELDNGKHLWQEAKKKAKSSPNVLMATSVGGLTALTTIENLLAVALTLRGANVHVLLCDQALPACLHFVKPDIPDTALLTEYTLHQHPICRLCPEIGNFFYEPLRLPIHKYSEYLTQNDRVQIRQFSHTIPLNEIPQYKAGENNVGEHAYAGVLRFFASGNLQNESDGETVLRRYFEGALLTEKVVTRLTERYQFKSACFNHGIYSPHGITGEVCRQKGIGVVNWNVAYRKRCFIFSHFDTYHHTMLTEPTSQWENIAWNQQREEEITEYLKSRWSGARDWIWFHEHPNENLEGIAVETGVDFNRPVIGMLTNVMWDAQLHYRANAFPDMLTWAIETIRYFSSRPELQLLIRIHPAEIRGGLPSRQPLLPELRMAFPDFPTNVFIIPPESQISTYAAMLLCDSVIIYGTKTGLELTSMGIPVIVGGEAWIRNKGLTIDASTKQEYFSHLDRTPIGKRMTAEETLRARKYAYHFFFRRMIPFKTIIPSDGTPPYNINVSSLEELMPGSDPGLDIVCNGILTGSHFVYPAEKLGID